jgi:hypothetical protein
LVELGNSTPDVRGSINNIKGKRLGILLADKPICARYFFYSADNTTLAIEDPALFYYMKILDWDKIKKECGFRDVSREFEFDFGISFAGENRNLAKEICDQLEIMDCSVFFDELYEANYLGRAWGQEFRKIFVDKCRFVVCLLDTHHEKKIWPTFERECFTHRVGDGDVIPIYLDDTIFVGIPRDIIGIRFDATRTDVERLVTDEIVWKLLERLSASGTD